MKFSKRTLYGFSALLALASRYGEGALSASQIARQENIPTPYLEQIFSALKKRGFVKSVRGPQGGYVLNRKPSEITLHDFLISMEEKKFLPSPDSTAVSSESSEAVIASLLFFKKFESLLKDSLSQMTLKQLVDEARHFQKVKLTSSKATFHI